MNISLQTLYLEDANGQHLLPGDQAEVQPPLQVVAALRDISGKTASNTAIYAQWVVDGRVVATELLQVNAEQATFTALHLKRGAHVIRLQIKQGIRMVANPFLVQIQ